MSATKRSKIKAHEASLVKTEARVRALFSGGQQRRKDTLASSLRDGDLSSGYRNPAAPRRGAVIRRQREGHGSRAGAARGRNRNPTAIVARCPGTIRAVGRDRDAAR